MALTRITQGVIKPNENYVVNNINSSGVTTSTNFKTGTSNLHNVGIEIAGINVLGADTPIGTGATIYNSGAAIFSGDVKVGGALTVGGVLTYEDVTSIDSVGVITARGDISIADKIVHTGDTNTALRFPSADTFSIETNGLERFAIEGGAVKVKSGALRLNKEGATNSIEIGQGQTGDNYAFIDLIGDTTYTDHGLRLIRGNTGANATSSLVHRGTGGLYLIAQDAGHIVFQTNGSSRAKIASDGKVGINTTNPAALLHLQGTGGNTSGLYFKNGPYDAVRQYFNNGNDNSEFVITYDGTGGAELTLHSTGVLGLNEANGDDVLIGASSVIGNARLTIGKAAAGFTTAIALHNTGGEGSKIISSRSLVLGADYDNDTGVDGSIIGFETNGTEKVRIASDGKVLIGTNTNRSTRLGTNSFSPDIQLEDDTVGAVSLTRWSNSSSPGRLILQKGRGTGASPAVVADDDHTGQILFSGWDGDTFTNTAQIRSEVDGTPGDDDMPGRLIFAITPDGSPSSIERLRINSTGQLELRKNQGGVTGRPENRIVFKDLDPSVDANQPIGEISWYSTDAGMTNVNSWIRGINEHTNGSGALLFGVKAAGSSEIEAMRIGSNGRVGINTDLSGSDGMFQVFGTGVLARFGNSISSSYECLTIRNNTAGYPAISNDSSGDTLDLKSLGSVQATIDSNNNSTGKYFRVMTNGEGGAGTELFRVGDDGILQIDEPNTGPKLSNENQALKIDTGNGVLTIGSQNTNYAHFYTDRTRYYFNKKIIFDEGILSAYNDDIRLTTGASPDTNTTGICLSKTTNYVGIGTNIPDTILHIVDTERAQGSDYATLSLGSPSHPLRRVEIGARRSTRGGDWDHVGIGFKVHESSNHTAPPETKMVLDYNGYLGVGTSNPLALLHVSKSISTAYDPTADSAQRDGTATINIENNDGTTNSFAQLAFDTAGTNQAIARIVALRTGSASNDLAFVLEHSNTKAERLRIDSVGRLLVGTDTAMTTASNDHRDTIQGVDSAGAQLLLARNDTSTAVSNRLGEIAALTNDSGGNGYKVGASIRFEVSATHGSGGDHPTAICFKTCTDGSESLLERIRVNHDGNLLFTSSQIQKINDTSSLVVSGGDNSNVGGNISLYGGNHSSAQNIIRFRNSASEAMRINGDGDISINRADNTSSSSILHISSHDVTTKYNNDNTSQYALLIDTHFSGTETLTANRTKSGLRMDAEYLGTGTKSNVSGTRNSLYGIHATSTCQKDTYVNYAIYGFAECAADDQEESTTVAGVYGYGRNYSSGGSNRTSTIYGGYFLGYRGGDINAGHLYGVYARAHQTTNGSGKGGDMTSIYAECEFDEEDITNAYAFRGHMDRDAGTITNGYILYGSYSGDSSFTNRWGIYMSDSAKNYLQGNLEVGGTLTKGGGTFRINHPLPALKDKKDLVHSFVEGPQMDLIYRGKVDLVNGTASVNIDTKAGMTEGTFVILCRDIQCFTSNETGWTAVKGSVTGNIITIVAQDNTCTDTISWMVVGERQDDTVKSLDMTDDNGDLIVEPDRSTHYTDNYKYQPEEEKNEYNIDPNADPGAE